MTGIAKVFGGFVVSKQLETDFSDSFYGYRWYDPYLQRWLSRDPLGEKDAVNLYAFVHSCPLSKVDSFGLRSAWQEIKCICAIKVLTFEMAATGLACATCLLPGEGLGVGDAAECIACAAGLASIPLLISQVEDICVGQPERMKEIEKIKKRMKELEDRMKEIQEKFGVTPEEAESTSSRR